MLQAIWIGNLAVKEEGNALGKKRTWEILELRGKDTIGYVIRGEDERYSVCTDQMRR